MAWKLNFVIFLTVLNKILSHDLRPPPFWGWEWPHDQYSQVASAAYEYPMNSRRLRLQPIYVEEPQNYDRSHQDSDRTNIRALQVSHGRSIASGNRRNSQFAEQVNTYRPQTEDSIERSENEPYKVISSTHKYSTNTQRLRLQPFIVEEAREYTISHPSNGRTNTRSIGTTHERSIDSGSRRNQQEVLEQVITYRPQFDESLERSENASSKVLHNFLKPIRKRGQVDNNKIIFPGPTVNSHVHITDQPKIPDSCKQSTFCEDVLDYPEEAINKLIKELGAGSLPLDKLDRSDTPDIIQRVGPTEENLELCESRDKVVYPLAAAGPDGKWYTVINRKDNPVQGFRVELCETNGSNCSDIVYFQPRYTASCKQKYVLRTAAVLEKVGDTFVKVEKQIQMPSCCSCVAKVI